MVGLHSFFGERRANEFVRTSLGTQQWLYGYDAYAAAEEWLNKAKS